LGEGDARGGSGGKRKRKIQEKKRVGGGLWGEKGERRIKYCGEPGDRKDGGKDEEKSRGKTNLKDGGLDLRSVKKEE